VAPTAKSSASATTRPRDLMEMSPFGNPLSLRHLPRVSLAHSSVASHEPAGQEPLRLGSQRRIDWSPKFCPPPGFPPPIWAPIHVIKMQWELAFPGGGPHGPGTDQSYDTVMLSWGAAFVQVTVGCPDALFATV